MAIKSQIRLQQLTGSVVELKPTRATPQSPLAQQQSAATVTQGDVADILKYYAFALANIHGNEDFGAQVPGLIKHERDAKLAVTGSDQAGFVGNRKVEVTLDRFQAGGSGEEVKLRLTQGSGASAEQAILENSSGQGDGDASHQGAVQFNATAGGIGMQWAAAKKLYGDGGMIDLKAEDNSAQALSLTAVNSTLHDGVLVDALAGGVKIVGGGAFSSPSDAGQSAINLEASNADGLIIAKAGSSTLHAEQLAVSASHVEVLGGAKLRARLTNMATSATDAPIISLGGIAGAQNLWMGDEIRSDSTSLAFHGSANGSMLRLGLNNRLTLQHVDSSRSVLSGSAKVQVTGSNGLELTAEGVAGGVILSGSQGLGFAVDGGFNFGPGTQGTLMFSRNAVSEGGQYRTNFPDGAGGHLSVVAALNNLKGLISNTQPTLLRRIHSGGTVSAGTAVTGISLIQGDYTPTVTTWLKKEQNQIDVFVNGQLLVSGSEGDRGASNVDYNLSHDSGNVGIKFSFDIRDEDVITVIDRS